MLKVLLIVTGCFGLFVVAVLIYATTKPGDFRVVRIASINAPPDNIFPLIADFHRWMAWSPYEKKDPGMKRTYGGAPSGTGSTYAWDGDKNVGAGSMEMTEAAAPSKVRLKLDFSRPFEAHNTVVFSLTPQGERTVVSWDMQGPVPYFAKIMHVFVNMDRMVGSDFEVGLANLKSVAEGR